MATTAKELIEYLKTIPPETNILCGKEVHCSYDTYMVYEDLDLESSLLTDTYLRLETE